MEPIKSNGTQKSKTTKPKKTVKASVEKKEMNPKEKRVVEVIVKAGPSGIRLEDIAAKAFTKKGTAANTKGNSWVRNSIRRPLRWGLIRKMERGTYVAVAYGKAN